MGLSVVINAQGLTEAHQYCRQILPKVSRTFAININVLQGELHRAVLCGYLFCRIADTFEDTSHLTADQKIYYLQMLANIFKEQRFEAAAIMPITQAFQSLDSIHPYHDLVHNSDKVFVNFLNLRDDFQQAISQCVQKMCAGMCETVARKEALKGNMFTLITLKDLDQYCYYVAGTVGELLTDLFAAYSSRIKPPLVDRLRKWEISFGLGLQVTNIIKDCYRDYQRGWCYIPVEVANRYQVPIDRFFSPEYQNQATLALNELVDKAVHHLDEALNYTLSLPRRDARMRLFCLWPLMFAIETLRLCRNNSSLVTGKKAVKISRRQVTRIMYKTSFMFWHDHWLKDQFRSPRRKALGQA